MTRRQNLLMLNFENNLEKTVLDNVTKKPDVRRACLPLIVDSKQLVCTKSIGDKQYESPRGRGGCGLVRGHSVHEGRREVDVEDGVEENQVHSQTEEHKVPVRRLKCTQILQFAALKEHRFYNLSPKEHTNFSLLSRERILVAVCLCQCELRCEFS